MRARLAAATASLAGFAGTAVRTLPGVLGALCVVVGLGIAWAPLGFIAAGAFLLIIDRRVP